MDGKPELFRNRIAYSQSVPLDAPGSGRCLPCLVVPGNTGCARRESNLFFRGFIVLHHIFKKAIKAGGADMPVTKYAKVFGNDTALRRNVLFACGKTRYGEAILAGTVSDHRVIESLIKLGDQASGIVLDVEARLGRKLTRSKIQALTKAYLQIRAAKASRDPDINVIAFTRKAA